MANVSLPISMPRRPLDLLQQQTVVIFAAWCYG